MSYQVLARKYRPANFNDLEGQEHVLQALINALDNERLHHAYLFTGTRGVGKTTIARILARCLNCETGITSTPCGECHSCLEIAEGRSVDLIEVDAASRTGVDDMRELLDNVQYMPTVSRFKIYLIDEVHMLSRSSFNAMLKTLEEPPEHVKFLFATTDPKKLPITVLSRCLQFNLKNMSPEQIVNYLGTVLGNEGIASDETALWQLGHAADGSMRDALSLTDQAISFGAGEVRDGPVGAMLGSIDQQEVYELLDAISAEDGVRVLARVDALSEFAPDYEGLLDSLLSVLHRIAIAHAVPDAVDNAQGDRELVMAAGSQMSPEQVQLLYQIALIGQRDLALAPNPRTGFEMVLLRMMSFFRVDDDAAESGGSHTSPAEHREGQSGVKQSAASAPVTNASRKSGSPIAELLSAVNGDGPSESKAEPEAQPPADAGGDPGVKKSEAADAPIAQSAASARLSEVQSSVSAGEEANADSAGSVPASEKVSESSRETQSVLQPAQAPRAMEIKGADSGAAKESLTAPEAATSEAAAPEAAASEAAAPEAAAPEAARKPVPAFVPEAWSDILTALPLTGVPRTLAANCELASVRDDTCLLRLSESHASLWNKTYQAKISEALGQLYDRPVRVEIEVGAPEGETPAEQTDRLREEHHARALQDMQSDDRVQQLIEKFGGRLDEASVTPRAS